MTEKAQINPEKLKVLSAVMDKIEKDFGKGAIMKMSSKKVDEVPVIPTGSITIDQALGIGGYPKGRVMAQARRKLTGRTSQTRPACIFINKPRDKIGVADCLQSAARFLKSEFFS